MKLLTQHLSKTQIPFFAILVLLLSITTAVASAGNDSVGSTTPISTVKFSQQPIKSFIRLNKDNNDSPVSLDIAIARYQSKSEPDLQVDLIGAVHFGEKDYYANLNKQFLQYDALLYELIGPKDQRPDPLMKLSPVGKVQMFIADLLTLEHQLIGIDYQAKNFVHADSSMEDLQEFASTRGDTGASIIAGVFQDLLKMTNKLAEENKDKSDSQPFSLPQALDMLGDPLKLKQIIAKGLMDGESNDMLGNFPTLSPYILDSRNDQALKILRQEIAAGNKKIGVFYGAAHLKDLEQKLFDDFDLHRTELRWEQAWDLTKSKQPQQNEALQMIRAFSALTKLSGK